MIDIKLHKNCNEDNFKGCAFYMTCIKGYDYYYIDDGLDGVHWYRILATLGERNDCNCFCFTKKNGRTIFHSLFIEIALLNSFLQMIYYIYYFL